MPPVNRFLLLPACCAGLLCLAGCSLEKHLARVSTRVEDMYAQTRLWEELPKRTITWQQACALMMRNSIEIKKADDEIRSAERESLSIYTDMIPGVSYYGYLNSTIDRLSETVSGENELNSNVNVSFSLPALTQVPYQVYSHKVQTFAAIKAREGKERELISQLYKATRTREIAKRMKALESQSLNATEALKNANEEREAAANYWQEIARLVGDPNARWEILPQSLPRLRWADYEHKLNRLDPLVVCNFAMQLEQARMSQYSIALRYLPTINTSLYSPSLFSSTGGTYSGTFLSGEDTRLNLSISYTLDTDLGTWNNYQRSKTQYEYAQRAVADSLREHKIKVDTLRRSVSEYHSWRNFMLKRISFTEKMPAGSAEQYIEQQESLLSMRRELLTQENSAVESEAALILEYGLPGEKKRSSQR